MCGTNGIKCANYFAAQGGLCFWCGTRMVLFDETKFRRNKYPRNLATYDHPHSKLSKLRGDGQRGVSSCIVCNHARGMFEQLLHRKGIDISGIWNFVPLADRASQ